MDDKKDMFDKLIALRGKGIEVPIPRDVLKGLLPNVPDEVLDKAKWNDKRVISGCLCGFGEDDNDK
jgi:hypothetical protein